MKRSDGFLIDPAWKVVLADLGVSSSDVARSAGLPDDLLMQDARLSTRQFFTFWRALELAVGDPMFPIRATEALGADQFGPCRFAVLCSSDLRSGLARLSEYKRLVAPIALDRVDDATGTTLTLRWTEPDVPAAPVSLVTAELAYFTHIVRIGTRRPIRPTRVTSPMGLEASSEFTEWFGVPVEQGPEISIRWSAADAQQPFLTANEGMWEVFEPELKRRLAELDGSATVSDRVRAALLEGIPAARFAIDDIGRRLGISRRTLQRRLKQEGSSFQEILRHTRERLARHYLTQTDLTASEIGFLLGFGETSSFFRAFHDWTGKTPETLRRLAS